MSSIGEEDYKHAKRIWKEFGIHNLGDYQDLYLRKDVVLLANVFEAFRDICLKHYKLDPAHFYASLELAWCTCLKCTGIRLELLTDPDMLLMFEQESEVELLKRLINTHRQILTLKGLRGRGHFDPPSGFFWITQQRVKIFNEILAVPSL